MSFRIHLDLVSLHGIIQMAHVINITYIIDTLAQIILVYYSVGPGKQNIETFRNRGAVLSSVFRG